MAVGPFWCFAVNPPDVSRAGNAVALFLALAAVLGVLVIGTALVLAAHRRRQLRSHPDAEQELRDPWREAAQRVQPYEDRSNSPD